MTRVLIGIDGSPLARQAARTAAALFGPVEEMTVLQVVRPVAPLVVVPTGAVVEAATLAPDRVAEESNAARRRDAEVEVAATAAELDIGATSRVLTGDPASTLCRVADEDAYDVVVVGSHGSGFLKRLVLGSVSHHVLHHAPCPVLVVPAHGDDDTEQEAAAP